MGAYLTWGALGGMGAIIPPVVISVGVLLCYSFCVYQTNIVVWFKIRMGRKRGHLRIISCVSPLEYENGVQCNPLVRRCWLSHWGRGQLYHYSLGFSFSLELQIMYTILLLAHQLPLELLSWLDPNTGGEQLSLSSANPSPSCPTHQQGMI